MLNRHPVGTVFEKVYKGNKVKVVVKKGGYSYNGTLFPSLSAAVHKITKSKHTAASVFFKVGKPTKRGKAAKGKKAFRYRTPKESVSVNGAEDFTVTGAIKKAVNDAIAEINIAAMVQQEVRNLFRNDSD